MFPENKRPLLVKQPNQTSSSTSDSGVLYWKKLFQQQFPVCDTTIKNCPHLMATINDRKKIRLLELIMLDRDQYSLDIGQVKPVTIIDQVSRIEEILTSKKN